MSLYISPQQATTFYVPRVERLFKSRRICEEGMNERMNECVRDNGARPLLRALKNINNNQAGDVRHSPHTSRAAFARLFHLSQPTSDRIERRERIPQSWA